MALVCCNVIVPKAKMLDDETRSKLSQTKTTKTKIAIVNFIAIVAALYLYDRHNRYCESGVYSMFSLLEYVVIVANIVYHLQAYHEFGDYSIIIVNPNQTRLRLDNKKFR